MKKLTSKPVLSANWTNILLTVVFAIVLFTGINSILIRNAIYRADDFVHLYYCEKVSHFWQYWIDSSFVVGPAHWRPFSLWGLGVFRLLSPSAVANTLLMSMLIFSGVVLHFITFEKLAFYGQKPRTFNFRTLPFLVFVLVAALSSSLSGSIVFLSAGVQDGFVFIASGLVWFFSYLLFCTESNRPARLTLGLCFSLFVAFTSKENGLTCLIVPTCVYLFSASARNKLKLQPLFLIELIKSQVIFILPALFYFWLRIGVAKIPFSTGERPDTWQQRFVFMMQLYPEVFFHIIGDRGLTFFIRTLSGISAFICPIGILIYFKHFRLVFCLLIAMIGFFIPFLVQNSYGCNQWSLLFPIPAYLFVFTFFETIKKLNTKKSLIFLKFLVVINLLFILILQIRSTIRKIPEIRERHKTYSALKQTFKPALPMIQEATTQQSEIVFSEFPRFNDDYYYLYFMVSKEYGLTIPYNPVINTAQPKLFLKLLYKNGLPDRIAASFDALTPSLGGGGNS